MSSVDELKCLPCAEHSRMLKFRWPFLGEGGRVFLQIEGGWPLFCHSRSQQAATPVIRGGIKSPSADELRDSKAGAAVIAFFPSFFLAGTDSESPSASFEVSKVVAAACAKCIVKLR